MPPGLSFDPFDGKAFRLRVGLRPLSMNEWIVVDDRFDDELTLKRVLLDTRPEVVVAQQPEGSAAAQELFEMVRGNLARWHPFARPLDGASRDDVLAIDRCGRMTQEDWCVLAEVDGALRLVAASLCFPNRWTLSDKLGLPMREIHGPVPGYDRSLASPTDLALSRLTPDRPQWRMNWSMSDDPTLHQPGVHGDKAAGTRHGGDIAAAVYVRVERQTFVRLPNTGAIVFGIRTFVRPIGEAFPTTEARVRLATALRSFPDDLRAYKSLGVLGPEVLRWAESC